MDHTNQTVYRAILDLNRNRLSAPALRTRGEVVSYGRLFEMADRVADILTTAGLGEGGMIIAQIHGTPESAAVLLGASKIGVSVMMLNEQTREEILEALIEQFDIRFIFLMEKFFLTIADYSFIDDDKYVIVLPKQVERTDATGSTPGAVSNIMSWLTFLNFPTEIKAKEVPGGQYPMSICSTSGSSGYPKGIVQTNQSCVELMRLFGPSVSGWTEEDLYACVFPFFLTSGQSFNLFLPLAAGMCVMIDPDMSLEAFYEDIRECGPTIMLQVKYNWIRLIRLAEERGIRPNLSRLRKAYAVGADLAEGERERINRFLAECGSPCRVGNLFGLSETNSILAPEVDGAPFRYFRPLEGIRVMCRSLETGEPVGAGLRGKLYFRTPCLMRGYLMEPRKTEKAFFRDADGSIWFDTEDVGYLTEDGGFVIEGRMNDLFQLAGKSVFVFEIRNLLEKCDGVRACEVYFSRRRDELRAYIVPEDEGLLSSEGEKEKEARENAVQKLDEALRASGKLALYPAKYCFLKAILLADSGKPDIGAMLNLEDYVIPPI